MSRSDTFVDEVTIRVFAGRGGDGRVHMRREKFIPRGGPDGGDGGRGGDVILLADRNLATLLDQRWRSEVRAGDGAPGGGGNRTGRDGESLLLRVPVGTLVRDLGDPETPRSSGDDGDELADLTRHGQRARGARGGRGGRGNARFRSPTRQAPDFAEPGRPGERRRLRLTLKLLADVGLVGRPNAGKSTLLRRLSAARPRVADYPFTTLAPSLGVAEVGERRFVVADIPGLIEGASSGAGLGDRFLRHVERTRVLVHLLDVGAAPLEGRDPLSDYDSVRAELAAYDAGLAARREIVALNKIDLIPDPWSLDGVEARLRERGCETRRISGATGEGVAELLRGMRSAIEAIEVAEAAAAGVSRSAAP